MLARANNKRELRVPHRPRPEADKVGSRLRQLPDIAAPFHPPPARFHPKAEGWQRFGRTA